MNRLLRRSGRWLAIVTILGALTGTLWAQESAYNQGRQLILAGDYAGLVSFLDGRSLPIRMPEPADIGPDFYPEPLVVEAIRAGRPDMVAAFLDAGLSVGVGATWDGRSLFDLLMAQSDPLYLELAATYLDDPGVVRAHFTRQLQDAVETGRLPAAWEVQRWVDMWNVEFDPGIAIGILAMSRDRELREILLARTPGIERFDPVARFVEQSPIRPGEYIAASVEHLASSFLVDNDDYFRYHTGAAFDGDLGTSWVEGRDDAGIGDSVLYRIPLLDEDGPFEISIFPGYGEERFFSRNNRLRRVRLEWYRGDIMDVPFGRGGPYLILQSSETLSVSNDFDWVTVPVPAEVVPQSPHQPPNYLRIVIEQVYPGSDWDDTCIAEVRYHHAGEPPR